MYSIHKLKELKLLTKSNVELAEKTLIFTLTNVGATDSVLYYIAIIL